MYTLVSSNISPGPAIYILFSGQSNVLKLAIFESFLLQRWQPHLSNTCGLSNLTLAQK